MQYKVRSSRGYHYVMVRDNDQAKWEYFKLREQPVKYLVQSEASEEVRLLNDMHRTMPILSHPQVKVHRSAEPMIAHASQDVRIQLVHTIRFFVEQVNKHEVLDIQEWYAPFIYLEVVDTRWKHYPCEYRALVSFDLSNGLIASDKSSNKYQMARKGWISRIRQLIGYEPTRYTDCGDKNKTTSC